MGMMTDHPSSRCVRSKHVNAAWYVQVFISSLLYMKVKGLEQVLSRMPRNLRCAGPLDPGSGTQVHTYHTHDICHPNNWLEMQW